MAASVGKDKQLERAGDHVTIDFLPAANFEWKPIIMAEVKLNVKSAKKL